MATFTTKEIIRSEAGFVSNLNITDATIERYQLEAHAYILGIVAATYDVSQFTGELRTDSQASIRLALVERYMAAGLLLNKEYGNDDWVADEGIKRIERAEDMLELLRSTETPVRLIDSAGNEFTGVTTSGAGGPVLTGVTPDEYEFGLSDKF